MKMFKLRSICLLLPLAAMLVLPVAAQPTKPATMVRHTLWKVQGERGTVHLLGSIHLLKEDNYPLPWVIESAFTNARIAAFETDIEALESPLTALKLLAQSRLPKGETLRDWLSAGVYADCSNHLKSANLPAGMCDQMKPMMAATTLVMLELQRLGFDPKFGLDKHFFARARAEGKQIVPLETVDFQIRLLTEMSKEEGELVMRTTLRDLDKLKKQFAELFIAWQTGDAQKLDSFLNEAKEEAPVIYKRLLTDRNRSWLPKIEELLGGDQKAVVIVGAGHLVGRDGLVELLKKKGFAVTQE